jgi:uncharacterized membrane protein YhiD involved in acid resistance
MEQILNGTGSAPLPLDSLVLNLLIGIVLGTIIAWYYIRFGKSLSNRSKFAQTLPVLALTTLLIISVVKSSLALSLGLIGALSIVRFRTAIKEPEELIFLFMAIAVGIGLGADQRAATVVAILIILTFMFVRHFMNPRQQKNNLFLNINTTDQDGAFVQINELLRAHTTDADLRRLDRGQDRLQATYLIQCDDDAKLAKLMDAFNEALTDAELSFVEQNNTLSG